MNNLRAELAPLPVEERVLTEVDNINRYRNEQGGVEQWVLDDVFKNLVTAVKEAGVPNAVSRTEHPYLPTGEYDSSGEATRSYMWLGKTAVQNAMSGRLYHKHESALKRVDVEIDEAWETTNGLRPGIKKVFISPRMTRLDADSETAKREHLADEDSIRVSEAIADKDGNIQKRVLESLLVSDVPLQAWVNMLRDPNNIFGKAIEVDDNGSALPVMQAHRKMEVSADALPEGVISIIEAVIPYVQDPLLRKSVSTQLERFREDQKSIDYKARNIARRWKDFEKELADSLYHEKATFEVERFIAGLQSRWSDEDLEVILAHQLPGGSYAMTRQLAVIVEKAKQNILWTSVGVITDNAKVLSQISAVQAKKIRRDEEFIQIAYENGQIRAAKIIEAENSQRIAAENIEVGGGCPGSNKANFKNDDVFDPLADIDGQGSGSEMPGKGGKNKWKLRMGKCVVKGCPTRPKEVVVGPCNVCMDRCQRMYDRGEDPTRNTTVKENVGQKATEQVVAMTKPELLPKQVHIITANKNERMSQFKTEEQSIREEKPVAMKV